MAFSFPPISKLPACEDHLSLKHSFKHYTYPLNQRVELLLSLGLQTYDAKLDGWKADRAMAMTTEEVVMFRTTGDPKAGLIPKKRVIVGKIEGMGVISGDPKVLVIFASRRKPIILKSPKYTLFH
jgi:hypothetical protein